VRRRISGQHAARAKDHGRRVATWCAKRALTINAAVRWSEPNGHHHYGLVSRRTFHGQEFTAHRSRAASQRRPVHIRGAWMPTNSGDINAPQNNFRPPSVTRRCRRSSSGRRLGATVPGSAILMMAGLLPQWHAHFLSPSRLTTRQVGAALATYQRSREPRSLRFWDNYVYTHNYGCTGFGI